MPTKGLKKCGKVVELLMDASQKIDEQVKNLPDWRGKTLTKLRKIIHQAAPNIKEEWKWDTAVFSQEGMVCAISSFKNHVKINFFKGAKLSDPNKLINSGLTSKQHRAIDFFEGDQPKKDHLISLIKEAVSLNTKN